MRKILLCFILVIGVHEFYIPETQAATKCENIDTYSKEYIDVWTIFIESTQSHLEIYSKDPDSLSPDEYEIMVRDITTLMSGLVTLSPPPALRGAWAAEISYWATYVGLLNSSSAFGPKYASNEYASTIEMVQEHLNQNTRIALGYCPIWQDTINELNRLIEGDDRG